jgi:hypothetical protein|tara:strand:- start:409 stop:645 length:237 start_codon:yes stop_codon:yes gene_type:complete
MSPDAARITKTLLYVIRDMTENVRLGAYEGDLNVKLTRSADEINEFLGDFSPSPGETARMIDQMEGCGMLGDLKRRLH